MKHHEFIKKFQYSLGIYCEFHLNTFFNGFYFSQHPTISFVTLNIGDNITHKATIQHINMVLNHPNTICKAAKDELEIINWWKFECINSTGDGIK